MPGHTEDGEDWELSQLLPGVEIARSPLEAVCLEKAPGAVCKKGDAIYS